MKGGSIVCIILAAALGACAQHSGTEGVQTPAETRALAKANGCPMVKLSGVHTIVTDMEDGVAITFVAPQNELDQLRQNVHAMNDANDKEGNAFLACTCSVTAAGSAEAMPGEAEPSGSTTSLPYLAPMPYSAPTMPAANASVDETDTGAVLKLTAKAQAQIPALRTATRQYVRAMKNCMQPPRGPIGPG